MTGINEVAKEIHENAVAHGWWEGDRSFPEIIALCHSELSEALEEYRSGRPNLYCDKEETCGGKANIAEKWACDECVLRAGGDVCEMSKPEGIAVEMADCIIRILDWCGKEGIDIDRIISMKHEYNKSRPYRHGGKKC